MSAVVKIQGTQYLVNEGEELLVNKLSTQDKSLKYTDVLLYSDGKDFAVGKPFLTNCIVTVENLGEEKGDKLRVSKYKAKSRYRRTVGFRSQFNRLRIEKIAFKQG